MQIKNILTILTINFLTYEPRMKLFRISPTKKTSKVRKQSKARPQGKIKKGKTEHRSNLKLKLGHEMLIPL